MSTFCSIDSLILICIYVLIAFNTVEVLTNPDYQCNSNLDIGNGMEYVIDRTWNNQSIEPNKYVTIHFQPCHEHDGVEITVRSQFYNDKKPNATTGSVFELWNYEVIEVFFAGKSNRYVELEFGPHNQYLVLLLNGVRNTLKHSIPLNYYNATIDNEKKTWTGRAVIPNKYFPQGVNKFNCYSIHGEGEHRQYFSLFPTPYNAYDQPDFHRLQYFGDIDFEQLQPGNALYESDYWQAIQAI